MLFENKEKKNKTLFVTECFFSIQGEGPEIGKPMIFIRLQGCNITPKCTFCDSSFSWNEGKEMSYEELYNEISKYDCNNIVITGGEPTLQTEAIKEFEDYCWNEKNKMYKHSIETNGLINDVYTFEFDLIMVSPKKQKYNIDTLKKINEKPNTYFKFVYDEELWFEKIIEELDLEKNKVYIMPEGKTKEEQENKMEKVIEYCKKKGYMFSPRLHILVWNNRRAV